MSSIPWPHDDPNDELRLGHVQNAEPICCADCGVELTEESVARRPFDIGPGLGDEMVAIYEIVCTSCLTGDSTR